MYKTILIPVALEHPEERAIAVAKTLLSPGGKLILLNVVEKIPAYVAAYLPAGTVERTVADTLATLETIAADTGVACSADAVRGHASQKILDYAERNDAECIVIASHNPGLEDYFLGSTAARVVRHARCSVHVLR